MNLGKRVKYVDLSMCDDMLAKPHIGTWHFYYHNFKVDLAILIPNNVKLKINTALLSYCCIHLCGNVWFVVPLDYVPSVYNTYSVYDVWVVYVTGWVTVYGHLCYIGFYIISLFTFLYNAKEVVHASKKCHQGSIHALHRFTDVSYGYNGFPLVYCTCTRFE